MSAASEPAPRLQIPEEAGTVLVRVSGPDRPGITAGLMSRLSEAEAQIFDVEQITIRGQLFLSLVVGVPCGYDLLRELLLFGWQQEMHVDFEQVDDNMVQKDLGLVVTMVGREVSPSEFGSIADEIACAGGNIERIVRLATYPVMAYEIATCGPDLDRIRSVILSRARVLDVDISVQLEGLSRRAKRLVVMDVDSTLISEEVIELIADEAGCRSEVAEITGRAMRGEIDFAESLYERVALLEGLSCDVMERVCQRVRLTPGARTFIRTLKRLGYRTAIVSGGFTEVTDHLASELGIDHAFANRLESVDGTLTGRVTGRLVDRAGKAELLRRIADLEGIPMEQVVAVGDGANDLDMLQTAGLGIAFNAKAVVQSHADTTINVPYLDAVLFLLGIHQSDIADD